MKGGLVRRQGKGNIVIINCCVRSHWKVDFGGAMTGCSASFKRAGVRRCQLHSSIVQIRCRVACAATLNQTISDVAYSCGMPAAPVFVDPRQSGPIVCSGHSVSVRAPSKLSATLAVPLGPGAASGRCFPHRGPGGAPPRHSFPPTSYAVQLHPLDGSSPSRLLTALSGPCRGTRSFGISPVHFGPRDFSDGFAGLARGPACGQDPATRRPRPGQPSVRPRHHSRTSAARRWKRCHLYAKLRRSSAL